MQHRNFKASARRFFCLTHGLTMATHNMRAFERVPGITVES